MPPEVTAIRDRHMETTRLMNLIVEELGKKVEDLSINEIMDSFKTITEVYGHNEDINFFKMWYVNPVVAKTLLPIAENIHSGNISSNDLDSILNEPLYQKLSSDSGYDSDTLKQIVFRRIDIVEKI